MLPKLQSMICGVH